MNYTTVYTESIFNEFTYLILFTIVHLIGGLLSLALMLIKLILW
jgi:hypothetical protein